jgi:hypothetical protein
MFEGYSSHPITLVMNLAVLSARNSEKVEGGKLAQLLADQAEGGRYCVSRSEPQRRHELVAGNRRFDPHDGVASDTRVSGRTQCRFGLIPILRNCEPTHRRRVGK